MKNSQAYTHFAAVYDDVMKGISYAYWAAHIARITSGYVRGQTPVLELAAGTGRFASEFLAFQRDITISDISPQMLAINRNKKLKKTAFDMRSIPFRKEKFGMVICLFDSMNYLLTQKDISACLASVKRVLKPGGVFVFDCCLLNGSIKHEKETRSVKKFGQISYEQISSLNRRTMIHSNRVILDFNGAQVCEVHRQKIYPLHTLVALLIKNGFTILHCFKNFTMINASPEAERVHFVLRKS